MTGMRIYRGETISLTDGLEWTWNNQKFERFRDATNAIDRFLEDLRIKAESAAHRQKMNDEEEE